MARIHSGRRKTPPIDHSAKRESIATSFSAEMDRGRLGIQADYAFRLAAARMMLSGAAAVAAVSAISAERDAALKAFTLKLWAEEREYLSRAGATGKRKLATGADFARASLPLTRRRAKEARPTRPRPTMMTFHFQPKGR